MALFLIPKTGSGLQKLSGRLLQREGEIIPQKTEDEIIQAVFHRIVGLGPIEPYLNDPQVTEIMVNAPDEIFVEKDGELIEVQISFRDEEHILNVIDRIVAPLGRRVDESTPFVDARLPDGSRVNAIIPPLALRSPALTIRRFSPEPFTLKRLVNLDSLNLQMAGFLQACIRARLNILISGGTGSGKTSTLNALARCIPEAERLVTIEDTAELQLMAKNLVSLESRPPNIEGTGEVKIRTLVHNALRMRPDRIIVGEVRGPEAFDMLQAMNTGHPGSLTTVHANSPEDAVRRLESMVLMAGLDLPQPAIREQIASSLDLIVQQERLPGGKRKIVSIAEVHLYSGSRVGRISGLRRKRSSGSTGKVWMIRAKPWAISRQRVLNLTVWRSSNAVDSQSRTLWRIEWWVISLALFFTQEDYSQPGSCGTGCSAIFPGLNLSCWELLQAVCF